MSESQLHCLPAAWAWAFQTCHDEKKERLALRLLTMLQHYSCGSWWLQPTARECVPSLSRVRLFAAPWTVICPVPQSMEFSRQKYWSGWEVPPPGDLPGPEIQPVSLASLVLAGRFFTTSTTWEEAGSKGGKFLQKRWSADNVKDRYYRIASML